MTLQNIRATFFTQSKNKMLRERSEQPFAEGFHLAKQLSKVIANRPELPYR